MEVMVEFPSCEDEPIVCFWSADDVGHILIVRPVSAADNIHNVFIILPLIQVFPKLDRVPQVARSTVQASGWRLVYSPFHVFDKRVISVDGCC